MGIDKFRIVLGRCEPERRPAIRERFKELFGANDMLAKQVVNAAPIVILAELSRTQAMEIVKALEPLRTSGGSLRIEISDDRSISTVAWPELPRVAGRELSFYEQRTDGESGPAFTCPHCGACLLVHVQQVPSPAAKASGPVSPPEPAPAARDLDEDLLLTPGSTGLTPPPQNPVSDDPLFEGIAPLPQTPLPGLISSIDDIETGINQSIKSVERDLADMGKQNTAPTVQERAPQTGKAGAAKREPGSYNVILNRTGNPQAIPLFMEDLKITEDKARLVMKKPLIVVARNLSRESAIQVATRYKKIGLKPRIGRKK